MLNENIYSRADLFLPDGTPLFTYLGEAVSDEILAPYFRRAENENLYGALGEKLFDALRKPLTLAGGSTAPAPALVALREACAEFVGAHALAKFWPFSQTKMTYGGAVRKRVDQSEPIDPNELLRQATEFLNSAKVYERRVREYVEKNSVALQLAIGGPAAAAACCEAEGPRKSAPVAQLAIRKSSREREGRRW
jgi:hypothetical protein